MSEKHNSQKVQPTLDTHFALSQMEGNSSLYLEIVELYLQDSPEVLLEIEKNWSDRQKVTDLAHKLRGMSLMVGALSLSELCQKVEEGKGSTLDQLKGLFNETYEQLFIQKGYL